MTENKNTTNRLTKEQIRRRNFVFYLQKKIGKDKFKYSSQGSTPLYSCPRCLVSEENSEHKTLQFMKDSNSMFCHKCGYEADLDKIARELEPDKAEWSDIEFARYLAKDHSLDLSGVNVSFYLKMYEKFGWDLVPCRRVRDYDRDKEPFEKQWTIRTHKNLSEWESWIKSNYNMGVKTGKISNILIVDVDTLEIPDVFKNVETVIQKTHKGYHYFFEYDSDFPKTTLRKKNKVTGKYTDGYPIDIETDGGQCIIYPSIVGDTHRSWNFSDENAKIAKMPEEIKKFLLDNIDKSSQQKIENLNISSENVDIDLSNIAEQGSRNMELIKLGGILRKNLSMTNTQFVIELLNRKLVHPPLDKREIGNIIRTLDKYVSGDDSVLAEKILRYLDYASVEDATSQDICVALNEKKENVDRALAYLIKEQYVIKRNRNYHLIKKIHWRTDYPSLTNEVDFKVPYFHDVAIHNWGDMVVLGGMPGTGKTTISMNFIKRLVDQGVKPYYVCLETGSRFIKTACNLGLTEGDFYWSIQTDPTKIEIEPNSVTIIDWLMIKDKAMTDSVFQYFSELLVKTNAFLMIFCQLKKNGSWFAENMTDQFPAFAARYLYDEDTRITGAWHIDKIRESKFNEFKQTLPCKYFFEDKTLRRIDEVELNTSSVTTATEEVVI